MVLASKKYLKLFLKIVISALFVVFLFNNSDIKETLSFIAKSNPVIWIIGVLLYVLGQTVCAYKWKLLAGAADFKGNLKDYIDYYFTGMFFNLFLPTTVGGDIVKCYYLSKGDLEKRKAAAIYSVLADRITGITALIWLAAVVIFLPVSIIVPFAIKLFIFLISLSIIIFAPVFPALCGILKNNSRINNFLSDINVYWHSPLLITRALCWSAVFHLIIVVIHILIGYAIGIKVPVLYYFIIYPMSSLAGFLPISFNGIGPREATYIYFLTLIGIKSSAALAFGIFWFGIVLMSSLIGGISYLKDKQAGLEANMDEFSAV
jgi:uncharacterized protein (TIRG00374 family)